MRKSQSLYGGSVAVLVLGIGFIVIGKVWAGLATLAVGSAAMGVALAPSASGQALFVSFGAVILAGLLGYRAISNEITGTATYRGSRRFSRPELVTRDASPAKFRQATNFLWAGSILCLAVGAVAFGFSRKLDNPTDF